MPLHPIAFQTGIAFNRELSNVGALCDLNALS